ncbi:5'-nucleotidase C-terminal domain-containing protein [Mangrovibacillus cuniculi]|uniref:2,' 3'-cyclic nucleotide 2'-phosphodiesterase n=1 Tax=Mangrovibacillus cuniculi TaxID=2593652 RepID=A0A7S8CCL8_9BACI|nr:5'-nucleotidase C-terminal domain-containing protein [Mangrovibacillus cuniculi]QPC47534.1 2,' 3'-cyclic nucleotide 2'-phosphodiesterase [Mangrovibacillus cuniculi]
MLNKTKKIASITLASALTISGIALPTFSSPANAAEENIKVQLLSVNDLHGNVDYRSTADLDGDGEREAAIAGMSYLAAHWKQREAENTNTIKLHAGDMIGGSPLIVSSLQDEPVIEMMEALGMDVGVAGNHEFDEGIEELKRMINGGEHPQGKGTPGYDGQNFPLLGANVYDKSTDELVLDPYHIEEVEGQKIGFIGVVTTATPNMVIKTGNENLDVRDEVEAINKYTAELKDQGVRAIVVLAHNPAEQNMETGEITGEVADFANEVDDEVDIFFAGHNHKIVNGEVDGKLIVQAFEYSKMFADVDIEIDPSTGDIVKKEAQIVYNTRDIGEDPEVGSILKGYKDRVAEIEAEVVGENASDYPALRYPKVGVVSDHPVGNLIADAQRIMTGADIALMNGGGIRDGLNAGEITVGEIYSIQPFANEMRTIEISGASLREIMNNQISSYGLDYSISGFRYTYTYDEVNKTGEIVDLLLPTGQPLDETKTYTVAMNNYMLGADISEEMLLSEPVVGAIDATVLMDYIKKQEGPINAKAEGRITRVKDSSFTDVAKTSWFNPYVWYLNEKEIVAGTSATTYSPNQKVTREQFASLVTRSLGLEETAELPFTDLSGVSETMKSELAAAYKAGIVAGKTTTTFAPKAEITRAEMVTMLMRAYEVKTGAAYEGSADMMFDDIVSLNTEMKAAVEAAADLGYVVGNGTSFRPADSSTRAEAARVLAMFLHSQEQ